MGQGTNQMTKGILSKIKNEKKDIVHVQVLVPRDLYNEVAKILKDQKPKSISWQKALLASVESIRDDYKKK